MSSQDISPRKFSLKPWDEVEFASSPISSSGFASRVEHEPSPTQMSFWDALKASDQHPKAAVLQTEEKSVETATESVVCSDERRWSTGGLELPALSSAALAAARTEHQMSFRDGLRMFPNAIFWSGIISLAIVGESFDTSLINSLYAFQTFQEAYGIKAKDGTYQVSTKWQTALNNGAIAGTVFGLLINGKLSERFGYRRTLMGALSAQAVFIFLPFFAFNIQTLLAGQILLGVPWGICSTLSISYAAEVMPLALRGYLTASVNTCWIIGQIISLVTLRAFLGTTTKWSYRIPFALQWVWVVIVMIGAWAAPESPWWLVRKGRTEDAKRVLIRLAAKHQSFNASNVIAMMQETDRVEKQLNNGKEQRNDLSYFECFRGSNMRRTEIACAVFAAQNLSGLPLIGFAAYFYRNVGFDVKRSFDLTLGMHGLAFIACMLSLILIRHVGRRAIYLYGLSACACVLLSASVVGTLTETRATLWAQAALVVVFIFVFDLTIGPGTYMLVGEIPSTRLRINTIILARISYNICAVITNVINTRALNPLAWNLHGKANYIWTGTCLMCLVYCWFRLPETGGLTYHELDILFEKKVAARKFASVQHKLEETGYFGFYAHRTSDAESAAWR